MSGNEWKVKYYELKNKWLDSVDKAYRMGYEIGGKETQMDMQQQQAADALAAEQGMVDENGMPIDPAQEEGFIPPPEEVNPEQSAELDAHIQELEGMVSKGEKPSVKDLRKTIDSIANIRKNQKDNWTKKVEKTSSKQKQFVDGLLSKWGEESKDLTSKLEENIKEQGLKLED